MSVGRRIAILLAAGAVALSAPGVALACLPYTYAEDEDHFRLEDGVRWAFVADVAAEVENPDTPGRPLSVVLEVRERIVGDIALPRLRVKQDDGCDGFWYRKGDRVIAAIGQMPGVEPPFVDLTNYQIAVWVIRDGQVDATIRAPVVGGEKPETERELRAALGALPDTATIAASAQPPSMVPLMLLMTAFLTAVAALGRFRPTLL